MMTHYGTTETHSTAFTAFDGIPFTILAAQSGVYGPWEPDMLIVERHVPRSNRVYRQNMGASLARITLSVELDSLDDYRRLYMAYAAQKRSRLTLLAEFALLRGAPATIHRDYEHFDNVVIDRIAPPSGGSIGVDQRPECTITFAAAWDPQTMMVVP